MNNEINNQNYNEVPINNEVNNQNYNEVLTNDMMSSQNYNQIQSNNTMNNQSYNQMSTNNTMNNQSYGQMSTNNTMNNQSYGQMSTNNTMNNQNYSQMPQKNDKNKNTLFLIIGVAVLIVIAIVILIVTLNKNKSKGNTINDYENNVSTSSNNNQEQVSNDNNQSSQGSISYEGFDIPKQPGYAYKIDSTTGLLIGNDTFAVSVLINHSSLDEVESKKDQIIAGYENQGVKVSNVKVSSYSGKKVLTMEVEIVDSGKAIFYTMDASNGYCFFGVVANSSYTINYSDIDKVVSLLSNAKYTGSYRANTDDINKFEIKNPFKK